MTKRTMTNQFGPEYGTAPAMPAGFQDASWGNDACPKFERRLGDDVVTIWLEAPEMRHRETQGKRYTATWGESEVIAESEDWDAFLMSLSEWLLDLADAVQLTHGEAEIRAASTDVWLMTEEGIAEVAADELDNQRRADRSRGEI